MYTKLKEAVRKSINLLVSILLGVLFLAFFYTEELRAFVKLLRRL